MTIFDAPASLDINAARLNHLDSLGLPLVNRTVLEVGAGIGLLTNFFESKGCSVVSTDARIENIKENLKRHPNRKVYLADLGSKDSVGIKGVFDVVFCYGTLYHVKDPSQAIYNMASVCEDLLLIETCVHPNDNGSINLIGETAAFDQSVYGVGCRPARDWVFKELSKYFPYVYISAQQPNHAEYPIVWPSTQNRARAVFVASRNELALSTLSLSLSNTQGHLMSLKNLCQSIQDSPESSILIMKEFDLLYGHPWEVHAVSSNTTYYNCLQRLAASVDPHRIVEIGTAFGMGSAALIKACKNVDLFVTMDLGVFGKILGLDGEDNIEFASRKVHSWVSQRGLDCNRFRFFKVNTQPAGTDNENYQCTSPRWDNVHELVSLLRPGTFDVLFVDGKHTGDGLLNDIKSFWYILRSGGILICDDLHDTTYNYPWAGDTIRSFNSAVELLKPSIAEWHIWNFPSVSTPGRDGIRPFGIIVKK